MACFAGKSYQEIQIEKCEFLPVSIEVNGKRINILNPYGQLYPGFDKKEDQHLEKKENDQSQQIKGKLAEYEQQSSKFKGIINEKEIQLQQSKEQIKDLNKQIDLLNDLVSIQLNQQSLFQTIILIIACNIQLKKLIQFSQYYMDLESMDKVIEDYKKQ